MFGSVTLDVLVGLVTIYLVFGLVCTAVVESISSWLGLRSGNLENGLSEFLAGNLSDGRAFVDAFYAHPLVQMLSKGATGRPSYIQPELVVQVVESLLTADNVAKSIPDAVASLPGTADTNRIKGVLEVLVKEAAGDVTAFRRLVAMHFDATMERAAGWFKRNTQLIAIVTSVLLVIGANVDTVAIAHSLALSPEARGKLLEIATKQVEAPPPGNGGTAKPASVSEAVTTAQTAVQAAGLDFGWRRFPTDPALDLTRVIGLIVSMFAVSLGAPFWFDVLQRFMKVRAAGKKA